MSSYIPPSFSFQSRHAEAHIAYNITALFVIEKGNEMIERAHPFVVSSRYSQSKLMIPEQCKFEESGFVSQCMSKLGFCTLKVKRDRQWFYAHDRIPLYLSIDNDCHKDIKCIRISLVQRLNFEGKEGIPFLEVNSSNLD